MIRKLLVSMLVIALVLSITTVASAETTTTSPAVDAYLAQLQILRSLSQGMSGDDVKLLQAALAADPDIYPEGLVTGYFGALTSKAVRKYQQKNGISAIGVVGPMTRAHLLKKIKDSIDDDVIANVVDNCAKVPPGHFIAPGQLKKRGAPTVLPCRVLPPGILKKLGTTTATTTKPQTADTTAPVISSVDGDETGSTTASVTWRTNESASRKVTYGTSSPVLPSSNAIVIAGSGMGKNHTILLSNLIPDTTYYFIVTSADAAGNVATSSQESFETDNN